MKIYTHNICSVFILLIFLFLFTCFTIVKHTFFIIHKSVFYMFVKWIFLCFIPATVMIWAAKSKLAFVVENISSIAKVLALNLCYFCYYVAFMMLLSGLFVCLFLFLFSNVEWFDKRWKVIEGVVCLLIGNTCKRVLFWNSCLIILWTKTKKEQQQQQITNLFFSISLSCGVWFFFFIRAKSLIILKM